MTEFADGAFAGAAVALPFGVLLGVVIFILIGLIATTWDL
jgi:hypothetical protein